MVCGTAVTNFMTKNHKKRIFTKKILVVKMNMKKP